MKNNEIHKKENVLWMFISMLKLHRRKQGAGIPLPGEDKRTSIVFTPNPPTNIAPY